MAHAIFFYIFSAIAIVSSIMVTASKNTVHSVFFLILDFISISCLFIMIGAPIMINKHEILIKSKIKKKTECTVFFDAVTIIDETIAIAEKI